jgi:hypothetical protein
MEKVYKAVPDVEALQYKGTPKKPDIKIFVSHRIDLDSETIDNPLYIPVRCGAVYDEREGVTMMGDDTGNNISSKKKAFSEFTVQYWAWKNVEADYYGLCHYRRYLSFADRRYHTDEYGFVSAFLLNESAQAKYGLLDAERMEREIGQYDAVLSEPNLVKNQPTPKGKVITVREMWEAHDGFFITAAAIDEMFRLIDRLAPEYSRSGREYFDSGFHRGYNCYVMRKELFTRLCEFQFPILFEMEHWLSQQPYQETLLRIPAYIGEMLYGVFTYHIQNYEQWNIKERQFILFKNTEKVKGPLGAVWLSLRYGLKKCVRTGADVLLPRGSQRRFIAKEAWYKFRNRKSSAIRNE